MHGGYLLMKIVRVLKKVLLVLFSLVVESTFTCPIIIDKSGQITKNADRTQITDIFVFCIRRMCLNFSFKQKDNSLSLQIGIPQHCICGIWRARSGAGASTLACPRAGARLRSPSPSASVLRPSHKKNTWERTRKSTALIASKDFG